MAGIEAIKRASHACFDHAKELQKCKKAPTECEYWRRGCSGIKKMRSLVGIDK
jgi:hypothetical protein